MGAGAGTADELEAWVSTAWETCLRPRRGGLSQDEAQGGMAGRRAELGRGKSGTRAEASAGPGKGCRALLRSSGEGLLGGSVVKNLSACRYWRFGVDPEPARSHTLRSN